MFTRTYSFANLILLLVFLSGLVSACSPVGSSISAHDQEHALLLQISSHVRLTGEPDLSSYVSNSPRTLKLASLRPLAAPATTTELDIVVDLYSTYLSRLQAGGNLTNNHVDKLATQLQRKIQNLNKRSEQLENRRGRRRRGLAGFFRRVGRSIGRFVRQLGRALGRAAEYLIEDVAPDVIRNMVLTGQPLNAKVFWSGVRTLVRTRFKTAIGARLARRGIPMGVLAKAGLNVDMESDERSEDNETSVDNPENVEIGYGNWQVDLITDEENCGGTFEWVDYWQNLPKNDRDDCQPALDSTHHVDVWIDSNVSIPLTFELDSGKLKGGFETNSFDDITAYQTAEGSISAEIVDGWVRPRPDNHGWEFGGSMSVEVQAAVELRCWYNPEDPQTPGYFYWINDDKTITVETPFTGQTDQFYESVDEGDPGVTSTGGTIDLYVGELSSQAWQGGQQLLVLCKSRDLPGKFPPPFLGEIGD